MLTHIDVRMAKNAHHHAAAFPRRGSQGKGKMQLVEVATHLHPLGILGVPNVAVAAKPSCLITRGDAGSHSLEASAVAKHLPFPPRYGCARCSV